MSIITPTISAIDLTAARISTRILGPEMHTKVSIAYAVIRNLTT